MKYQDPKMEAYWNTLPADIQAAINRSGIDLCSLGMLTKLGEYYKNMDIQQDPEQQM
ncbi:MAG: hypothetical protein Q3W96_03650 [Dysosmobacter sp.]|uniref:hypothetical protein n=1 Tax=Dysosmobacter sp. TaxID=2591382 RepID=UPI00283EAF7E|nr:hypothetical protein [Dysosmobacter sp.]MDR3982514.1 hypothetical protein [Dysosmobacter sp.]